METLEFKMIVKNEHFAQNSVNLTVTKDGFNLIDYVDLFNSFLSTCGYGSKVEIVKSED